MTILSRLKWLIRYRILKLKLPGLHCDVSSYCNSHVSLSDNVCIYGKTVILNAHVDQFTYLRDCSAGNVSFGKFCSIGPGSKIGGLGKHPTHMISTHPIFYSIRQQAGISFANQNYFDELPRANIGNDVWIGANVIVLDGINIGNGAIVAAGSVVIRDVPAYSIVAGVPAKVKRYRFSDHEIQILESLQWWNLPVNTLKRLAPDVRRGNVELLLKALEKDQIIRSTNPHV
jgi:chloramphenicol O-acetyltransferase type B